MADIDPDTLLEWLTMGAGDERDMQVIALEQLCMLLLMSDNVDRCFESCPPRSFLPALCHIFMDETAPDNILEVTARAITYYLDVSAECSRRIVTVEGAVKALCTRLVVVDISSRTSKDLAEQCVKVLELMCTREAGAIYEAGGLNCMLTFIREYGTQIHKDTLHSAMSVVARLCSKMEPTDETLETCMDSLSKLLQHEDNYVTDTALKCFACLADRFTRRGVDPAPLAKHGLTEELLKKLVSSAMGCGNNTSTSLNASISESRTSSGNVSIIVSVLSMLCRGSPSITHDLLRSSLPDAIETAMNGDERCVLDTMRLVDLLLILLFEGRDALPKSSLTSTRSSLASLRKLDSAGDKSHRQLIDCIRSKDTDALVEAVDSSQIDVNFMDDVGQTLLNWAAAFGTLEMVEFLCDRGADVNRGQRSSSLHYAACFGRPAVAKVLLRHGANPELRDDDGKSPLDKARERNDEGHKEVVRILQSPGEWLAINLETNNKQTTNSVDGESSTDENHQDTEKKNKDGNGSSGDGGEEGKEENENKEPENVVKGDPEAAPIYVKRLVPVFANTFQASLIPSVKKATLSILKKMIHFIPASMMDEVVSGSVASQLVDVIAVALSVEEDDEGHLAAFHCIQDLMSKGANIFLIHFIRLGVLQKISELASESEDINQDQLIDGKVDGKEESTIPLEDATKILPGLPYYWQDWCVVRGRDCLYLWSDYCAIELSNGSNGWFRFVLDGKLATMYSSGSPEGGSSSSESRTEFLDKLQRARTSVPSNAVSRPILSSTAVDSIVVGNWTLSCRQDRQLTIVNTDGQQATILKEDLPGFLFESNRGTKHTFTAEISLGPDFAFSWSGKQGKKFQSRKDQIRQKLSSLAHSIYCKYFKDADLTPHGSMATLIKISKTLNECVHPNEPMLEENKAVLLEALKQLCAIIVEETMLSSYEIQTSGLVIALNNCLNKSLPLSSSISMMKEHAYSCEVFKKVFGDPSQNISSDESMHLVSPAVILVRKLIMVLESSERLPVLSYESAGGGSGLQVLLRRLRFKLERGSRSSDFINRSGRSMKMEPLTTIGEVQSYLLKMVAKQWYDYERSTFQFVKEIKKSTAEGGMDFEHQEDFDENGILYWIGTNGKTAKDWVNPAKQSIVLIGSSEGRYLPYGRLEDIISRDSAPVNCHTNDNKNCWFIIDLGVNVVPTAYTFRHARGYGRSALRNWLLQMSKDGTSWVTLKTHENDESLQDPGSTATWKIELPKDVAEEKEGWHFVRIKQNGPNASGQTYYLSLSGFEIYGKVTGVIEQLKPLTTPESDNNQKKQRRIYRSQILRHMALSAKEGSDWKLLHEQARLKALGDENKNSDAWVDVSWRQNNTSANNDNNYNVKVVDISDPDVQGSMLEAEKRGKNESNKASVQSTLDNTLKQVVMSFGAKRSADNDVNNDANKNKEKQDQESSNDRNEEDKPADPRIDLANLQFLMAVEDLLDSSSSDLVANALAEAASLRVDQLRLATQSFRNTLLASSKSRPTPSAQGSRESQSPPTELNIPVVQDSTSSSSDTTKATTETKETSETAATVATTAEITNSETDNKTEPTKEEDYKNFKEDCITHLQKISSSMSQVLDSIALTPEGAKTTITEKDNEENSHVQNNELDDVEFCEMPNENALSVAENNFLNDNHSALETNVISIFNEDDDVDDDDDDDDDNEYLDPDAGHNFEEINTIPVCVETNYNIITANEPSAYEITSGEKLVVSDGPSLINNDAPGGNVNGKDQEKSTPTDITLSGNEVISQDALASMLQVLTGSNESVGNIDEITQQALKLLSGQSGGDSLPSGGDSLPTGGDTKCEKTSETIPSKNIVDKNVENTSLNNIDGFVELTSDVINSSNVVSIATTVDSEKSDTVELLRQPTPPTIIDISASTDNVDVSELFGVEKTGDKEKTEVDEDNQMYTLEEILQIPKLSSSAKESASKEDSSKGDDSRKKSESKTTQPTLSTHTEQTSVVPMDVDDADEDDDDEDDDDDFDDIENEDENDTDDMYETMQVRRHYDHQRRMWDDDLVLKCQHNALVPAFDPRPGRTNVQQTQDIEIPAPDAQKEEKKEVKGKKIRLYLRGTPTPGGKEIEIPLENPNATIFSYVQMLILHGMSGVNQSDRLRRAWEPNFTIVYKSVCESAGLDDDLIPLKENDLIKWDVSFVKDKIGTLSLPKSDVINYLQQNCDTEFLKKWKLTGTTRTCRKQRNCSALASAYKDFARMKLEEATSKPPSADAKQKIVRIEEPLHRSLEGISPIQQVLDVIKSLHRLTEEVENSVFLPDENVFDVPNDEFLCKKLMNKLVQQIQDPLTLASGSLPLWCEYLVINYPTLFPFETRQMFFRATAFGCSRSIVWLQSIQDANNERSRVHLPRRLEAQEFRIGRLKHERVTVPRGEELLETAIRLMDFHAERKSVLEIEFKDEEGTGLGPSLEFYALIAVALQRNDLKLWVSMDHVTDDATSGYSHHVNGLFPAPFPQDCEEMPRICRLFSFLGVFLAKCLQDNRLIDIPLSAPFFKMLCASKGKYSRMSRTLSQTSDMTDSYCDSDNDSSDDVFDSQMNTDSVERLDSHYFSDVLTEVDFDMIHPNKSKFMKQLKVFVEKRQAIQCDRHLNDVERKQQLDSLMFVTDQGMECKLDDLGLTFQYIPSSTVYGFDAVDLKPGGGDELLISENAEEYMELLIDFTMHRGIAMQLEAFRAGFNRVFPMEKLHAFKPREVRLMLCGEQAPQWTFDELMAYTEPKYGYHKDSPGFIRLINVLVAMTGHERKEFLQFATGCSSLPPGGISNLHPRLTVVKKDGENDGSYPSVNTCVHYLKLPEYSSEEVLREKLLAATREKGFHLN